MLKIVVLMSTYNGEKYLSEQIESIFSQKGEFQMELFVRDDGSTDNTCKILDTYAARIKLRWYGGENIRPQKSFMELIHNCGNYDFYIFADQDDVWYPEKLKVAIDRLSMQTEPSLFFSNARLINADGKDLGRNTYREIPKTDFYTLSCAGGILGCTMTMNHKLVEILRKEMPKSIVMHDFYAALVCSSLNGLILYDERAFIGYRQHENNVVGVSYGIKNKFMSRIHGITAKAPTSIADQAQSILDIYGESIDKKKRDWLIRIANYRESLLNRLRLATSCKVHYINRNMGLTNRMAIMLSNR